MPPKKHKTTTLGIRLSEKDKIMIQRRAEFLQMSVTDYLLMLARADVEKDLEKVRVAIKEGVEKLYNERYNNDKDFREYMDSLKTGE